MQNARLISFLVSIGVGVLVVGFLSLLEDSTVNVLLVGFGISFGVSFIFFFATLEIFVFRDLRRVFRLFDRINGRKNSSYTPQDLSIKKVGKKLSAFAKTKDAEIENLKKIETFRREFLADISHELKTPVFAAQGFIHTLIDGAVEDTNVRDRFLEKSAKSLDDLNNLVQDLITISQVETGEIILQAETFDMVKLINDVFEKLEKKASDRNISLHLRVNDPTSTRVSADYFRMNQVITNLVDNAIKYGNEKGKVQIILSTKKDRMEVSVKDDGPGISAEHAGNVFRRFYRVDKSRSREKGGTGLGLAIVRYIIEAHDQEIKLDTAKGKGCKFTFHLNLEKTSVESPAYS